MNMRRLNFIALGMALLASLSLQAQRGSMGGRSFGGGARAGSGFHSAPSRSFAAPSRGFASGPSRGFVSGPRAFAPGARSFAPAPRSFASRPFTPIRTAGVRSFSPVRRSFAPFPNGRFGFHRFHHRFFFRDRFFTRGCFGCFSPFFFGSGFFLGDPFFADPFYAGYPGYGYPPPPPAPVYVNSDNGSDAQLAAEVQQLTDEIEDMREEERDRDRSDSRAAAPNTSITAKEPGLPVEFIFHDGRRISATNYAIAGETLWVLDEHAAKKFSVADLDVDATQQANAAKGIDIHIPAAK
jgi:hypothetical protein